MDGGAWEAAVHGVTKSRTRLSDFTFTFPFHALEKEMATHSSVLAWRIPGTGEPGGLKSMRSHRVGQDWRDLAVAAAVTLIKFSAGWVLDLIQCPQEPWKVTPRVSNASQINLVYHWIPLHCPKLFKKGWVNRCLTTPIPLKRRDKTSTHPLLKFTFRIRQRMPNEVSGFPQLVHWEMILLCQTLSSKPHVALTVLFSDGLFEIS